MASITIYPWSTLSDVRAEYEKAKRSITKGRGFRVRNWDKWRRMLVLSQIFNNLLLVKISAGEFAEFIQGKPKGKKRKTIKADISPGYLDGITDEMSDSEIDQLERPIEKLCRSGMSPEKAYNQAKKMFSRKDRKSPLLRYILERPPNALLRTSENYSRIIPINSIP